MLIYMWSRPISYLHHTLDLASESKYSTTKLWASTPFFFPKRMTISMLRRTEIIFFWLSLLFTVIFCHNKDEKLQVVGFIEHRDFTGSKVKVSQTFSGKILLSLTYVLFKIGETVHKTYAIANPDFMHALCRITCYGRLQVYRRKD